MPAISVIVPVYKVEPYLRRCVDSILGQTFTDFELILVDDGSPDNCPAICDEYAAKDSRVHVIHQENGGLSSARNAGIDWAFANSDSQWLTFIDSDDWIHPQYLEILLFSAQSFNVEVSICGYADTTGACSSFDKPLLKPELWNVEDYYTNHYVNANIACCKLYKKACFANIRYPVGKIHEDEYTTYKILFNYNKIVVVDTVLYYYFRNACGITKSKWVNKRLDILDALEERLLFFQSRQNQRMIEHTQKELETRSILVYLQAVRNHQQGAIPPKYRRSFFPALKTLEENVGTDRYEVLMVNDGYPLLIKIQAYIRKIKELLCKVSTGLFQHDLSIVCIAKNEGSYIKEWVDYHLLQGVDCIYLYDNESPDNMRQILEPYIASGRVVYTLFPGKARQLDAYNDAIHRFKHKTKYMAFIDCDEFLVPENPNATLIDVIESIMRRSWHCGGIAVNWRMYGSSGFDEKPEGFVIENFLYRGKGDSKGSDCIKTIANPRRIKEYRHVHYPTYYRGFYSVNEAGERVNGWSNPCNETKLIRINHYFTKSKQEWIERRSRGKADTFDDADKRTLDELYQHDHNEVYDPIMLPYAELLKAKGK